ncbi:hypothetical protein [Pseudokineococcus lusitanus]|uniref:PH (Pleckstrin Homology) domain-containing protein n=1 Tax=Pseudokineococcus lusitanus TaxID=763993 RepID=A0A3N1GAN9_9ACTN|nr:hypothetical protein [Pseudokineococcus lusitanus]ROP27306.1 hypothetical protein EDC03_2831 [Pseudokineococcus lusitanus]
MPPLRVDLTGLRERYDAGQEVPAMPRRRVYALVGAGVVLVVAYAVVVVGVLGEPLFRLLPLITTPLFCFALGIYLGRSGRHPHTRLTPTELHLREQLWSKEELPWADVLVVTARRAQKRAPGEVHLRDGRRLRLVGMPADDVVRLAEALDRARAAAADGR